MRSAIDRFMNFVSPEPNTGCWLWLGALTNEGYGKFWDGGRLVLAHRWAYEHFIGPLGDLQGCHRCDTPWCASPYHVFPGTGSDNMLDAARKGHNARHRHPERTVRGSRHWCARLTDGDVRVILVRLAQGEDEKALAAEYGVRHGTIWFIHKRKTWKHIEGC